VVEERSDDTSGQAEGKFTDLECDRSEGYAKVMRF
jgi:hypothetical protein